MLSLLKRVVKGGNRVFNKLNQRGFSHHFILPVIAILMVAGIGTYMVSKSKAYSYMSGVTPYSCSNTSTLRLGSKGNCVKALQYQLNKWIGLKKQPIAKLSIDGSFGPKTKAAVIAFQRYYKLTVDGIAGPQTMSKLVSGCNVTYSCTHSKTGVK